MMGDGPDPPEYRLNASDVPDTWRCETCRVYVAAPTPQEAATIHDPIQRHPFVPMIN